MSAPGQLMGPGASIQSDVIEIPGRLISLLFKVMKLDPLFVCLDDACQNDNLKCTQYDMILELQLFSRERILVKKNKKTKLLFNSLYYCEKFSVD